MHQGLLVIQKLKVLVRFSSRTSRDFRPVVTLAFCLGSETVRGLFSTVLSHYFIVLCCGNSRKLVKGIFIFFLNDMFQRHQNLYVLYPLETTEAYDNMDYILNSDRSKSTQSFEIKNNNNNKTLLFLSNIALLSYSSLSYYCY